MCNTTCANIKSAYPLSGLMLWNWCLFSGLTCKRRQTATKNLHHDNNYYILLLFDRYLIWLTDYHMSMDFWQNMVSNRIVENRSFIQMVAYDTVRAMLNYFVLIHIVSGLTISIFFYHFIWSTSLYYSICIVNTNVLLINNRKRHKITSVTI